MRVGRSWMERASGHAGTAREVVARVEAEADRIEVDRRNGRRSDVDVCRDLAPRRGVGHEQQVAAGPADAATPRRSPARRRCECPVFDPSVVLQRSGRLGIAGRDLERVDDDSPVADCRARENPAANSERAALAVDRHVDRTEVTAAEVRFDVNAAGALPAVVPTADTRVHLEADLVGSAADPEVDASRTTAEVARRDVVARARCSADGVDADVHRSVDREAVLGCRCRRRRRHGEDGRTDHGADQWDRKARAQGGDLSSWNWTSTAYRPLQPAA